MRKHIPFLIRLLASCFIALAVFSLFPIVALEIADSEIGKEIIFESSDGETLDIMGETLCISTQTLEKIRSCPKYAAELSLSFMPTALKDFIGDFCIRTYNHAVSLFESASDVIYGFLSIGT